MMDLLNKINAMDLSDLTIDELNDLVEYDSIELSNIEKGINRLIELAIKEKGSVIQESILNLAVNILYKYEYEIAAIAFDSIENNLSLFKGSCLEYSLLLLGLSKNTKYIEILRKHLTDSNENISDAAKEALSLLNSLDSN